VPIVALLDTNVWVSSLINPAGAPARLVREWLADHFEVVVSPPLLDELSDVLSRPRITSKYAISLDQVHEFLTLLNSRGKVVVPSGTMHECRDPDDDLVLETALLGHAQYVVTRDDDIKRDLDLIEHLQMRGVVVVTVQRFLDHLSRET
jgi:putative PIN family toxin of toxin-antitoxin system